MPVAIISGAAISSQELSQMSTEFHRREKVLIDLYNRKEYGEAFSMVEQLIREFPSKAGILYNYAYCIRNLMGDSDGALKLMEMAIQKGFWSDPSQLEADNDLKNLHDDPRFRKMLGLNASLAEESRKNSSPKLKIIEPASKTGKSDDPLPLIIALHGNMQSVEDAAEEWKFMAEKGWIVALPQSSQEGISGGYIWTDFSVAIPELKRHYGQIAENHKIDTERLVVAGFSMGGALAAQVCLDQHIPCRKFILVGPYIKAPADLEEPIKKFAKGGGRGYVLVGEKDTECIDGAKKLTVLLKANGVACGIHILENLAHEYPDGFESYAEEMLRFLLR